MQPQKKKATSYAVNRFLLDYQVRHIISLNHTHSTLALRIFLQHCAVNIFYTTFNQLIQKCKSFYMWQRTDSETLWKTQSFLERLTLSCIFKLCVINWKMLQKRVNMSKNDVKVFYSNLSCYIATHWLFYYKWSLCSQKHVWGIFSHKDDL